MKYPVTVMMNSYNEGEKLFRRAANSVIEAGCSQFIVSTVKGDKCIEWAKDYNALVIENEKPGIFSQVNAMLPHINQPYVCYSSSNDFMLPNKLELETSLLKGGKKVCYSAYSVINDFKRDDKIREFYDYSYDIHLRGNFVSDCAMVETETLLKYTPFKEEYGNYAYYDMWLRVYEGEGNVFVYNPIPTWVYHVTKNSKHVKRRKNKHEVIQYKKLKNDMIRGHLRNFSR